MLAAGVTGTPRGLAGGTVQHGLPWEACLCLKGALSTCPQLRVSGVVDSLGIFTPQEMPKLSVTVLFASCRPSSADIKTFSVAMKSSCSCRLGVAIASALRLNRSSFIRDVQTSGIRMDAGSCVPSLTCHPLTFASCHVLCVFPCVSSVAALYH